jgi:hypothetical protein
MVRYTVLVALLISIMALVSLTSCSDVPFNATSGKATDYGPGYASFYGRVTDNGSPVANVHVSLYVLTLGNGWAFVTDTYTSAGGKYDMTDVYCEMLPETYTIKFQATGYNDVMLTPWLVYANRSYERFYDYAIGTP